MKKTWREKFQTTKEPKVEILEKDYSDMKAGQKMAISTPQELATLIQQIPKGEARTIKDLRDVIAKKHNADGTRPLTTGIFLRIASEVALEEMSEGKTTEDVTPFWRAVDHKSPLAKKLSCGPELILELRNQEQ